MWLGIAIFCTGFFLIQFLMSVVFGTDTDLDADSSTLDASDFLSFKGLIHFGIGYSWWMVIHSSDSSWTTHATAFLLGTLVMVILWLTYWGMSKLKKEIEPEIGKALIGKTGEIYTKNPYTGEYTVFIESNGAVKEIPGVRTLEDDILTPGQHVIIKDYIDGKYYI